MDKFKYAEALLKKDKSYFKRFVEKEIIDNIEVDFKQISFLISASISFMVVLYMIVKIYFSFNFIIPIFLSAALCVILLGVFFEIITYEIIIRMFYFRLYFFSWFREFSRLKNIEKKERLELKKIKRQKKKRRFKILKNK